MLVVVAAAVALTQVAVLVTSIYLHRALAHRSLDVHPVLAGLFRTVLWLTTGQSRQAWVAVHRNSAVLAWVTGGESLHNNHHANPRAPKFSVGRREFDPSWAFIRALAAIRLLAITGAPVRLAGAGGEGR